MPSQFLKAIGKRVEPTTGRPSFGGAHQNDNAANGPGLLRVRGERPYSRPATEQRDELAPPHSITSSAATSNLSGTVRPSILAVSALMTSSILVDCSTGRSAGLAPLRMRPV